MTTNREDGKMQKYGMPSDEAVKTFEAWFRHQPTRDLRGMLADPEMPADQAEFVRQVIGERRSPAVGED
jgi:hypothetical protein